jgi:hypothetical protein
MTLVWLVANSQGVVYAVFREEEQARATALANKLNENRKAKGVEPDLTTYPQRFCDWD